MKDPECVAFLQWALPHLRMRWPGFRRVRRQVCKRVGRRLAELQLPDAAAYRSYLETHPSEWSVLDAMCRISISRFYRDRAVFDLVRDDVLPRLAAEAGARGDEQVRCWSAGCASGEEVYTLTIIWQLCVRPQFPGVRLALLGTDVDPHMIERAKNACYTRGSFKDLPADWLPRAFAPDDSLLCLKPEFKQGVELRLQDIRHELPEGPFDCILCRHLAWTYFDEPLQREVLEKLLERLRAGGFFVTGKQEPLPCLPPQIAEYRPHSGIYRKAA